MLKIGGGGTGGRGPRRERLGTAAGRSAGLGGVASGGTPTGPRTQPHPRSAAARVAAALLVSLTLATFAGVLDLGFVLDDFHYVHLNGIVSRGWTGAGVRAACSSVAVDNWHPLTWLSHMLDVELFDLEPAGHHAVSLLLHAANSALVFAVLRALTGALWRPALAAALFAVHPLRVESVAWVAERKHVLSAFLGLD